MTVASDRRRAGLLLAVPAVVLVVGLALAAGWGRRSAVDDARALLADDTGFETAEDAGITFVKISRVMLDGGEACADDKGDSHPSCEAMFSSSAFAQVAAVRVLECTHPGIFTAREAMREHVAEVKRAIETGGEVDGPEVPSCQ